MKAQCVLTEEVRDKIMHWTRKANTKEVSGYAKVIVDDGKFRVVHVNLLPQKNGGATTDIEAEDMAKGMYAMRDIPGELTCWWHSHANMGVFWSGTDTATMQKVSVGGYCLALVVNVKGEMKAALYMPNAFARNEMFAEKDLFLDNLEIVVDRPIDTQKVTAWDEEYSNNVKEYKPNYQNGRIGTLGEPYGRKLNRGERRKLRKMQQQSSIDNGNGKTSETGEEQTERQFNFPISESEFIVGDRREWRVCHNCNRYEHECLCEGHGTVGENDEPCPICGYSLVCDCDPNDKFDAQIMLENGYTASQIRIGMAVEKGGPPTRNGKTGGW